MPIDLKRQLLFIHIPKTGGSSVERALNLHPHQVSDPVEYLSGTGKHLQHLTYAQILKLKKDSELKICNKFCIIRNPVDRFGSEFRWRKKINHPLTRDMDELAFSMYLLDLKNKGELHKECHFRFQSDYFYVADKPSSDIKVFRLEDGMNLVEDWINRTFEVSINVTHANSTKKAKVEFDDRVIEIVKDIYSEDADKLGYQL